VEDFTSDEERLLISLGFTTGAILRSNCHAYKRCGIIKWHVIKRQSSRFSLNVKLNQQHLQTHSTPGEPSHVMEIELFGHCNSIENIQADMEELKRILVTRIITIAETVQTCTSLPSTSSTQLVRQSSVSGMDTNSPPMQREPMPLS